MEDLERPAWTPRAGKIAVAALVLLVLAVFFVNRDGVIALAFVFSLILLTIMATIWTLLRGRQRREFERQLEQWAADRAVQYERLRIARELHDLTSHGLGLIILRAAAAAKVTGPGTEPERCAALRDIEDIGREATNELRRMLTLLRTPGDDAVPLRPAETLDDLPAIIDAARGDGLIIEAALRDLGHPDPGVQLTICAVAREALANALRHAGPTTVHLTLERDRDTIRLDVCDAGPAPGWQARPGAGHGLAGLRERLALHGGALTATPARDGFRVTAELPDGARR
jgi:signal transduction histidine kinase